VFHHHITDLPVPDQIRFFWAYLMVQRWYRHGAFKDFPVNCHVLARVMARFLRARVASGLVPVADLRDGRVSVVDHEHSWVRLRGAWILDVKPIGMMSMSPILVDTSPGASVCGPLYQQYPYRYFPPSRNPAVARRVTELLQRTVAILDRDPITGPELRACCVGGREG
jgi:hypothetical protein